MAINWDDITIDGVAEFPFPESPLTITFGLTDPAAPDPVYLDFTPLTAEEIQALQTQLTSMVSERVADAEQIARGLGGNAQLDAIKGIYRELIDAQARSQGIIQHEMKNAINGRYKLEILRQMAAAI